MKSALSLFLLLLASTSWAAVWVPTRQWDPEWEARFSQWVASPNVRRTIFTAATSPYKGISADCADVSYVFRALFAFENSLPFSAKNPVATAQSRVQRFSHAMTRFDTLAAGAPRVVAFANYLSDSLGTETLAANDSFPLALDKIHAGDFFMYKKRGGDSFIRHTYNVKGIDARGNFNLIYATQAIRASGDALYERVKALYNAPTKYRWGFRRYAHPESEVDMNKASLLLDMSEEQYDLAQALGEEGFFAHVKALLRTEIESAESVLTAQLKELCDQVKERVDIVKKGLDHLRASNNACMDYTNFDTHSTPSRDGRLKAMVVSLENAWAQHRADSSLSPQTIALLGALLDESASAADQAALLAHCPIVYRGNEQVSLRDIRARLNANLMSSHPNDNLAARWGENNLPRTSCRAFY